MRLLALVLVVLFASAASAQGPSFLNEVLPVLTKSGCNSGSCHGKGAGQNGFRLSLRGYAPEDDHRWLTREFEGCRIQPAAPANSLLLMKPTGKTSHEGGRLFSDTSREYETLRTWIATGAPGPGKADARIVKLTVSPGRMLKVGESTPLAAIAEFNDGSKRDVTWLTRWDSNDAAVLAVSRDGVVTALRPGGSAVRAAFLTEVTVASFAVPQSKAIDESKFAGGRNVIDKYVLEKLQELRIEPSGLCDDAAFHGGRCSISSARCRRRRK